MLDNLFEITFQKFADFVQFLSPVSLAERRIFKQFGHLVDEFDRERREVVYEIERVLDLVRDAGRKLT